VTVGKKARDAVWERDEGECQFFCGGDKATNVCHRDHQGAGGLPAKHKKNQPPNLALGCSECHGLHQEFVQWTEFVPPSFDENGNLSDMGSMVVLKGDGTPYLKKELWFYRKWDKKAAIAAVQHLHTVNEIDAPIGRMMHDLRRGADLMDVGGTFDQQVSALGWDPLKANKIADVFRWAGDVGTGWPAEVNYQKMELIYDGEYGKGGETVAVEFIERARGGMSFTGVRREMIKKGIRGAQPRLYITVLPGKLKKLVDSGDVVLVRTKREMDFSIEVGRAGLAMLTVNAIKGGLKFKRGKEVQIVGDGIEIPMVSFEEWTGEEVEGDG